MLNKLKFKNLFNFHADRDRLVKKYNLFGDRVVGDIPIHPSNDIDPPEILHAAKKAGLGALLVTQEESWESGKILGTVYVYDRKRLQRLLNESKDMLKAAEWPRDADKFVHYMSWVSAPINSEIRDFIQRLHDVNGQDPERKPYRETNSQIVAQVQEQCDFSKTTYKLLRESDPGALETMQAQAKAGNTSAMTYIALAYQRGLGVKPDAAEAAYWAGRSVQNTIQGYRWFLDKEPEKARTRLGADLQPGDSDEAFWAASRSTANSPDAAKIRDEAFAQLSEDQVEAVKQRIGGGNMGPRVAPAAPRPAPAWKVWG